MSFQKVKVEGKKLTPELAQTFAKMPPIPGERDERPSRRDFLLRCIRNGTFGGPSWACGKCREDGKLYRFDGQHTSKLLSALPEGVPFPDGLLATIDTWEFDSIESDAPTLFNMFNHPKSARTNEDAMGVYRARVPTVHDIDRKLLQKIANGIHEQQSKLPQDKNPLYFEPRERGLYWQYEGFAEFASWAATYAITKNAAFLGRSGVVAEMLVDWNHDKSQATEFWNLVFRESHPEPDHETRTTAETFRAWSNQPKKKCADYRKRAATAWKHFLRESKNAA